MGNIIQPLWADCPAASRMLVTGYPIMSVALALVQNFVSKTVVVLGFVCCLATVVDHYSVWTIFVSAFYRPFAGGMSFMMMLFELYMGMVHFPARERDLGSGTFFMWLLLMNAVINVLFLAMMFVMTKVQGPQNWMHPNQGLWPLVFVCITLKCLADQDSSTNFWGLVNIPNKWYPIALAGFFMLLSMTVLWEFVAALMVGYAYPYLRLERLLPSRVRMGAVERRCCCANRRVCMGASWVLASDTAGYETETGDRRYATLSDFGRTPGSQLAAQGRDVQASTGGSGTSASFTAFAGSGNRLGSVDDVPLQPVVSPEPQPAAECVAPLTSGDGSADA